MDQQSFRAGLPANRSPSQETTSPTAWSSHAELLGARHLAPGAAVAAALVELAEGESGRGEVLDAPAREGGDGAGRTDGLGGLHGLPATVVEERVEGQRGVGGLDADGRVGEEAGEGTAVEPGRRLLQVTGDAARGVPDDVEPGCVARRQLGRPEAGRAALGVAPQADPGLPGQPAAGHGGGCASDVEQGVAGVGAGDIAVRLAVEVAGAVGRGDGVAGLEQGRDVVALVLVLVGAGELLGESALGAEAEGAGVDSCSPGSPHEVE
jgi:hypothetical protein